MTDRADLTRWNRAGLSRFDYVDGNAASFLERLRAKAIANTVRGLGPDDDRRDPGFWFDLFAPRTTAPDNSVVQGGRDALAWRALADALATGPETVAERNRRLSAAYEARSDDYAAEIFRAFARAAHVLTGHIDAYANETKLQTATQWDSLRKLAAMVNYAPAPAASASCPVGLILKPDAGEREIARGFQAATAASDGGPDLVFETLAPLVCHPDLNAVRHRRWNVNRTKMTLTGDTRWICPGDDGPQPGAAVVIAPAKLTEPSPKAVRVAHARSAGPDLCELRLEPEVAGTWRKGYTELWFDPADTIRGTRTASATDTVLQFAGAGSLSAGMLVEVSRDDGTTAIATILEVEADRVSVRVPGGAAITGARPMVPYDIEAGYLEAGLDQTEAVFNTGGYAQTVTLDTDDTFTDASSKTTGVRLSDGARVAHRFRAPGGASVGAVRAGDATFRKATLAAPPQKITTDLADPDTSVSFPGKAPRSLVAGAYYAARAADGSLTALRVMGLRSGPDSYTVAFNKAPGGPVETIEFLGPMTRVLRPEDRDMGRDPLVDATGWTTLAHMGPEARDLIRVGRAVIIEDNREDGPGPLLTEIGEVARETVVTGSKRGERDQVAVRFTAAASSVAPFLTGSSILRLNVVPMGHGEAKGIKVLGSGNGELPRQTFVLEAREVSFVADPLFIAGVRPDIDLRVDGVRWNYADLTDPLAEGQPYFSVRVREDGKLDILPRRRLPTGRDNVVVVAYRTGTGARANALPPGQLAEPKARHPHVEGLVQPFATSGGADREAPETLRENAGGAIAANGRGVSLDDITGLARGHAAVWDALAARIGTSARGDSVTLTLVPADGAPLTEDLKASVLGYLRARSLPGLILGAQAYRPLPVTVTAHLRVDPGMVRRDDAMAALRTDLLDRFSLRSRKLGQSLHIAEVIAACEAIAGVATATASMRLRPGTAIAATQSFGATDGSLRALHPGPGEVAWIMTDADIAVTAEDIP